MLKPEHVKTNLFGNCIINGQFRIGLSLFDFKQHCAVVQGCDAK